MMRVLKFKIETSRLILDEVNQWSVTDRGHFTKVAKEYDVMEVLDEEENQIIYHGKPENLFHFLHLLAYRYDIELA